MSAVRLDEELLDIKIGKLAARRAWPCMRVNESLVWLPDITAIIIVIIIRLN
jgi:hypothetical protein